MRIHRLVLRNYRAIREYRLDLPASGVVVIEGENEIGKSSIAEALWLVFEVPDSSDSERVRSIKPVDRDAATEVEIDVSSGPYRFTYAKRFHRAPRTELRVEEPRPEHVTGREAHDRATAILKETTDTALWAALRLLQGEALNDVALSGHLSLAAALDEAASARLGGDHEQTLMERAHREYRLYFTETGKENKDFALLRSAADTARANAERLSGNITGLEGLAERCVVLEVEVARHTAERSAAEAETERLRRGAEERQKLEGLVISLEAQASLARSQRDAAQAEAAQRQRLVSELDRSREQIAALEPQRAGTLAELHEAAAALKSARAAETAAETEHDARAGAAKVAGDDFSYFQERLQVELMAERVERVARNQGELRALAERLNSIQVNGRVLEELEALEREHQRAELRLEAEGTAIEVTAPDPINIRLNGEDARIVPGAPFQAHVTGEAALELPGGVEVRLRAGQGASGLAARATEAKVRLESRLDKVGVGSIVAARELETERRSALERRGGLQGQIEADLRDQTAESLAAKLERTRERVRQYEAGRPSAVPLPPSLEAAREARDRAEEVAAQAEAAKRVARERAREAADRHTLSKDGLDRLERQHEACVRDAAEVARNLQEAREARADAALASDLAGASEAASRLEREIAETRALLLACPDTTAALTEARTRSRQAEEALRRVETERSEARGALQNAGESGLHQQLQDAATALEAAQAELASFEARATAARLLFDTLRRHREAARSAYALPLQEKVQELGRTVFGPSFAVELDQELRIARRTLDGVTLEFGRLSVGAREQLGILLRLACASLVSKTGGVPLVLDDVLGWSDPKRLGRIGEVLALAARETQVLVLTCTPERFATVRPATIISLPSGAVRRQDADSASASVPPALAAPRRVAPNRPPTEQAALDLFGEAPAPTRN